MFRNIIFIAIGIFIAAYFMDSNSLANFKNAVLNVGKASADMAAKSSETVKKAAGDAHNDDVVDKTKDLINNVLTG